MKKARIAFFGRGRLGMTVLRELLVSPMVELKLVVSCAPTPEVEFTQSDFSELASTNGIEFHATNQINNEYFENLLRNLQIDLAVAMLWLYTISENIISTARLGFVNLHGGALPKYRGNACQTWAILNNEDSIGVTCHLMKGGVLDSGPIIKQEKIKIISGQKVGELIEKVNEVGARLVLQSVEALINDTLEVVLQSEAAASYCYPRLPRDGEINWDKPAVEVERLIRAVGRPYPGAYSWFNDVKDNQKIKKLTIFSARVVAHPLDVFYAVCGHMIKLNNGENWGVVCGDKSIILLDEIHVDGHLVFAADFFSSVRQRLGIDTNSLLAKLLERQGTLEQGTSTDSFSMLSKSFAVDGARRIDLLEGEIRNHLRQITKSFEQVGLETRVNPFRNLSFQKGYYQWESETRRYGIQMYQSLKLFLHEKLTINIGVWYWCDQKSKGLEGRVYLTPDSKGKIFEREVYMFVVKEFVGICANLVGAELFSSRDNADLKSYYIIVPDCFWPELYKGFADFAVNLKYFAGALDSSYEP